MPLIDIASFSLSIAAFSGFLWVFLKFNELEAGLLAIVVLLFAVYGYGGLLPLGSSAWPPFTSDAWPLRFILAVGALLTFSMLVRAIRRERDPNARIEANESLLREAINKIPDAFAIYDHDDRLILCNAAYSNMCNVLKNFPELNQTYESLLRRAIDEEQYTGVSGKSEDWIAERLAQHRAADGQPIEHEMAGSRWFMLTEQRMRSGAIVALRRDITALKSADEQLRKVNVDLEHRVAKRTANLARAREAAESANRSKSAFLTNMSHEIRTPMNGVVGMAEILGRTDLQPDQARMVKTIRESSQSLLRIIDDILDVSKIEAGKLQLENAPIRLRDVAEGVIDTLRLAARDNNVRLLLAMEDGLPRFIRSDPIRLRQVLMNLLGNAIKFSRQEDRAKPGDVQLRFRRLNEREITIAVRDDGIGISADVQSRLFQPFTQAEESTTRQFGGTGLGLVITENLVRMMRGSISVDSTPGKGSTFTVTLPFEEVAGEDTDPDISGLTVLALVDDDMNRPVITTYLRERGAQFLFFADETELAARMSESKEETIIFLALPTMTENVRVKQSISDSTGRIRFLIALADRADGQGLALPDCYVAQRFPLLPSELIRGIAVLAGRASPEIAPGDGDLDGVGLAAGEDAGFRILLVEDNAINQDVISTQVKLLGHGVEIAENGLEGLAKWKSGRFDLVLADCHMPKMDGFAMTGAIRDAEAANGKGRTPIIAITANALQGEAERCKAAGMDDYLSKPVVLTHLNRLLKQWLSSPADLSASTPAADSPLAADNMPARSETAVDPTAMVDVFGIDDRALFAEMMKAFVEKSRPDVRGLRDALQSRDRNAIVDAAHKLKSAARTIGANDLADLCEHIQHTGEVDRLRDHRIIGEEIDVRFDRVQRFVEDYAPS